jgi:hypothetical protein
VRLVVAVLVTVLLAGTGCTASSGRAATPAGSATTGDAELDAIKVPPDWTLSSSQFQPGGYRDPDNRWYRWYRTPASGVDALRAFDSAAEVVGWQNDTSCPLASGHGCWVKGGYHLTATAGEGSGCTPGDQVCAVIEVELVAR